MTSSYTSSMMQKNGSLCKLRGLEPSDLGPLEEILRGTNVFYEDEIEIALELIDAGLTEQPEADPYCFFVAELDSKVAGYSCYGSTPNLPGVYDLYWIAVDPKLHGQGIGQILLKATEDTIVQQAGHTIIIETSSRTDYAPTRKFYERAGYTIETIEPDYYAAGDNKVVYAKRFLTHSSD